VPVRRYRSVEEMEGPHWYEPGDPALYRAIRRLWALHARTKRPHFPPGVYRHRSVEEMNALQEQWDEVNFEAYRKRIEGAGGGDHGAALPVLRATLDETTRRR
jgi:hypothetical protein